MSVRDTQRQVAAAAQAFLDGRLGVLETVWAIWDLSGEIDPATTDDAPYLTIGAIARQANGLPVGPVRELWSAEALAQRDPIIARIEAASRLDLEGACRTLTARYRDI